MLPYCLVNSIWPINNYIGVVEEIKKTGKIEEMGRKAWETGRNISNHIYYLRLTWKAH